MTREEAIEALTSKDVSIMLEALEMAIEALEQLTSYEQTINKLTKAISEQEPKTEKVIKMRDVTPEERESIDKYIKSISKPTGVDFWNLEQEPFDIETYCKEHFCVMVDKDVWEKAKKALKQEPTTHGYMLVCPNCGLDVHSDFKTCPRCGAKMESEE